MSLTPSSPRTLEPPGLDRGGSGFGDNEALLEELIAESPALRGRMVLATKSGIGPPVPYDSGRFHLTDAVHDEQQATAVAVNLEREAVYALIQLSDGVPLPSAVSDPCP